MTQCVLCERVVAPVIDLKKLLDFSPLTVPQLCQICQGRFVAIPPDQSCPKCGRHQEITTICPDCTQWGIDEPFINRALYEYNEAMKTFFSDYKFRGDFRLRKAFEADMKRAINVSHADVVTIIPVDEQTLQTRGFNQVVGLVGDYPVVALFETQTTNKGKRQSERNRHDRMTAPQPFRLTPPATSLIAGKRVLIIDDVYTTGRTIRHAASLARAAGASWVQGLTLAHG
ncbi:ComF family protein [Secundilactobacillus kimchicus]|uniref:ComF family protein n=1 Tax=Secundilactobacillus kimchicus TaxID=528209 RepID=UPI0009EBD6BB|nr:phosphoribosyltransferase family protein [Secundilactobacillus kimchicus]MBT9670979.1 ComF family protein [Secundilactobacillus kimchicus]